MQILKNRLFYGSNLTNIELRLKILNLNVAEMSFGYNFIVNNKFIL